MEEETAASIQDVVEGEQRVESTTGSNNPGDLNVSNAMAASSGKELKELAACEQHETGEGESDEIGEGECDETGEGECDEIGEGECDEMGEEECDEMGEEECDEMGEECDGDKNATNIKIRVSSTDEVQFENEDEPFTEPIKSSNPVVGGGSEKRPIKLQRSDAQDDDASLIDTVDTTNTDVESIARDMKMLTTSTSIETQDPNNRKKTSLSLLSSQGSGGSVETTSSPCLSRDSSSELYTDSTGIDLEKFLIDSLQSKDRLFLLNIEKDVISFIKSPDRESYQFERMNTYHRMLVHRVAAFFGLDHNVDKATESVIVTKTKNTRLPELKFDDVQVVRVEGAEPVPEHLPKKLLKRSDFSGSSLDKSPDRIREGSGLKGSKSSSYEERHEKYVETRARIFASKKGQNSSGSEELSTSNANICGDGLCAGESGATGNSSQDDVSRGDKPWSSVDSDPPSSGHVCPPSSGHVCPPSSGHVCPPKGPRNVSNNGNRLLVPGVKKAKSFEEQRVCQGSGSKPALSQTKAASLNETSSGVVCDPQRGHSSRDPWHHPSYHPSSSSSYHPSSSSSYQPSSSSYQPSSSSYQPSSSSYQPSSSSYQPSSSSYQPRFNARNPNTGYWNSRGDGGPRPRGAAYRPRGPHPGHQPWPTQPHDGRQVVFVGGPPHLNPRFMKDQSHHQGEMILHQVANILGSGQSTSDQQQMQNSAATAGLFYQPVTAVPMQVAPQSVQVTSGQHHSSHPKNRQSAAGNVCNGSGQWQSSGDGRNNVQQSQPISFPSNQQVFQGQVPNVAPGQIDPRFLYLNCPQPQTAPTQYSVQSTNGVPFGVPGQNYVLMPTQAGIRPQVSFQPMTGQSVGMQSNQQVAFLPTGQPVMLQNGSNVSNGAPLLPLPFPGPFQCQPVPQNFQMQPPPNAAMTFKSQPQQQQPNQTPPLVLGTNSSPGGGVTPSSVSSYLPSGHLIVANPQSMNQNNHHLNSASQSNQQPVFYGHQMCPTAPPSIRFRPHHPGRGGHNR